MRGSSFECSFFQHDDIQLSIMIHSGTWLSPNAPTVEVVEQGPCCSGGSSEVFSLPMLHHVLGVEEVNSLVYFTIIYFIQLTVTCLQDGEIRRAEARVRNTNCACARHIYMFFQCCTVCRQTVLIA